MRLLLSPLLLLCSSILKRISACVRASSKIEHRHTRRRRGKLMFVAREEGAVLFSSLLFPLALSLFFILLSRLVFSLFYLFSPYLASFCFFAGHLSLLSHSLSPSPPSLSQCGFFKSFIRMDLFSFLFSHSVVCSPRASTP